ncbi:hypothetical protein D7V97_22285 [Corallococcus sp. CA053C]|uniref:hypothetical protein n=1 Tax=Corallococcus sp. CA053C TaxID=2316732 RepID=UPI000EA0FDBA|nr:hypothetical protein [Corallococcus sp. CA053C]RKH06704.1 hypothetical protein D7V97_22285 [Corallococcus sp. CA053C]
MLGQERLQSQIDEIRNVKGGVAVVGGALGATAAGFVLAEGLRSENKALIGVSALGFAGAALDVTGAGLQAPKFGKWLANTLVNPQGGTAASSAVASTLGKINNVGKLAGVGGTLLGAAFGIGLGAVDVQQGIEGGHTGQIAKGAVGIAGSAGTLFASLALSGTAGPLVGALFGFGALAVTGLIELTNDDKHQISELLIDDEGFEVKDPEPREYLTPEEQEQRDEEDRPSYLDTATPV